MIFNIARRYTFSKKNRHRLTSIRIAIGLLFTTLALNVILSFMIGLQDKKFSAIKEYYSYDAILDINDNTNVDLLLEELNNDSRINLAFKFLEVPTIINNNDNSQFVGKIRAFESNVFEKLSYTLTKGSFDSEGIILSNSVTSSSTFTYMKPVDLTILKKGKVVTIVPLQIQSEISAEYYTPMKDFNNFYSLMNYDQLKKYAPYTKDQIGVYGDIGAINNIVDDKAIINTWIDQNESLYAAMKLEQYLMYLTLSIMSFIILIQLYNSTNNLIKTKQGEIAMLRTLGITKKQTNSIFILTSCIISFLGIILGTCISFLLLSYSNDIIKIVNNLTNYNIPLLTVNVDLNFSLENSLMIALPLLLITYIMTKRAINKLLKKDNMEILLNE